jgi:hypothetical protein
MSQTVSENEGCPEMGAIGPESDPTETRPDPTTETRPT